LDQAKNTLRMRQEPFEILDGCHDFLVLVLDLLALESGKAGESHVENRLCLNLAQAEPLHEVVARRLGIWRVANGVDDLVNVIEGDLKPLEDMRALLCTVQLELGASGDNHLTMVDKLRECPLKGQYAWL